jgi:hypothetical protein
MSARLVVIEAGGRTGTCQRPTNTRGDRDDLQDYWLAPTSERVVGFVTKCRLPSPW